MGPLARNRVGDVKKVETAIDRLGFLDRLPGAGVFDSILDSGIRGFQRRNALKEDGLLKPKGPTEQMLNRIAAERAGEEETDKDKKDCARLKVELANAEQAAKEARERARKWDAEFNKWREEEGRLAEQLKIKLAQLGLETAIPLIRKLGSFRKLLTARLDNASTLAEVLDLQEKLSEADRKIDEALRARNIEEAEADAHQAEAERLRKQISAAGCG